jgi:hypothetical protein
MLEDRMLSSNPSLFFLTIRAEIIFIMMILVSEIKSECHNRSKEVRLCGRRQKSIKSEQLSHGAQPGPKPDSHTGWAQPLGGTPRVRQCKALSESNSVGNAGTRNGPQKCLVGGAQIARSSSKAIIGVLGSFVNGCPTAHRLPQRILVVYAVRIPCITR